MNKLPLSFYQQDDVVVLSQQLIGMKIYTYIDELLTGGIIVETEAYRGPEDKASHAYGLRRTKRNEMMYQPGGISYIYICYGIHPLLNIVTNNEGVPHAILLRAIEPTDGIETMLRRRNKSKLDKSLTAGPGSLAVALGLSLHFNGCSLLGPQLWIEKGENAILPEAIVASPRVGIDYAEEDAALPWRFRLQNNPWTSSPK